MTGPDRKMERKDGGFTIVELVHATWIAGGATASVNSVTVEGGGRIGVNDSGWPENTLAAGGDGTANAAECAAVWSGLLSSAPGVSTTAGAAAWRASVQGAATCRYAYNAASGRHFDYDTSTGVLTSSLGSPTAVTPAASSGTPSPTPSPAATCALVGIEPFLVLVLVQCSRTIRRRSGA